MFGRIREVLRKVPQPPRCQGCEARDHQIRFLETQILVFQQRMHEENRLMRDQVLAMANRPQALADSIVAEPEDPNRKSAEEADLEQAELDLSRVRERANRELNSLASQLGVPAEALMDIPPDQ